MMFIFCFVEFLGSLSWNNEQKSLKLFSNFNVKCCSSQNFHRSVNTVAKVCRNEAEQCYNYSRASRKRTPLGPEKVSA